PPRPIDSRPARPGPGRAAPRAGSAPSRLRTRWPRGAPAMSTTPARATFRRHERIDDPADFRRAFERKKTASDAVLIVYAVENGRDHPRLGISVGRKKVRRATARNRVKRLLREAFRLSKAELPAGVDLVVVPRGAELTFAL